MGTRPTSIRRHAAATLMLAVCAAGAAAHHSLAMYDLKLNLCPVFPRPGAYDFVLTANGEEVARQRFAVQLVGRPASV